MISTLTTYFGRSILPPHSALHTGSAYAWMGPLITYQCRQCHIRLLFISTKYKKCMLQLFYNCETNIGSVLPRKTIFKIIITAIGMYEQGFIQVFKCAREL